MDGEGDDGDVTQSNSVASNATALNADLTGQKATQDQSSNCRCPSGVDAAGDRTGRGEGPVGSGCVARGAVPRP